MKILKVLVLGLCLLGLSSCAMASYVGSVFGVSSLGSSKAQKLPGVFEEPSKDYVDPEITIASIKANLAKYYDIYKLVIYGDDESYEIRRNDLGLIVDKLSRREVWIVYKDLEDGKYYYNSFKYIRDFDGVAYGAPRANFAVPTEIDESLVQN